MDTGLIFEHFEQYVGDTDNDLDTPQGAVRLLREDSYFHDFVDNLTEGLESDARKAVSDVLTRQRNNLLLESAKTLAL